MPPSWPRDDAALHVWCALATPYSRHATSLPFLFATSDLPWRSCAGVVIESEPEGMHMSSADMTMRMYTANGLSLVVSVRGCVAQAHEKEHLFDGKKEEL